VKDSGAVYPRPIHGGHLAAKPKPAGGRKNGPLATNTRGSLNRAPDLFYVL
jgi:hypothetical protein